MIGRAPRHPRGHGGGRPGAIASADPTGARERTEGGAGAKKS